MYPTEFKAYQSKKQVFARLFQEGDEDGFDGEFPYIIGKDGIRIGGQFGVYYIVINSEGSKSLFFKNVFEDMYKQL